MYPAQKEKRQRCMLLHMHIARMLRHFTDPTVNTRHPNQNFIAAAVVLATGLRLCAADQCPLMTLSGLVSCLLFGLEPVLSSPCVIFSIKLM